MKISSSKWQITNKFQWNKIQIQNWAGYRIHCLSENNQLYFGHWFIENWILFDICFLAFGIYKINQFKRLAKFIMITIDSHKCNGCAACMGACNAGAIYLVDNKAYIDQSHCTSCGSCIEVCPVQAIQLVADVVVPQMQAAEIQSTRSSLLPTIKAAIVTLGSALLPVIVSKIGDVITAALESKPDQSVLSKRQTPASGRQSRKRYRGGA